MASVHNSLLNKLQAAALREGALAAGGVDWLNPLTQARYRTHVDRYRDWVQAGHAGPMQYLVRGLERRQNPTLVFPELKSAFVVLFPYSAHTRKENGWEYGPEHARYIGRTRATVDDPKTPDYHTQIKASLERVMAVAPGVQFKICVDTSAVLERAWGELSGLGWIGKNTLLIHPQWGSHFFIGVVFLDQELGQAPELLPNYCGACTRCLDACPTQAFLPHGGVDSRRCLSALTLETRGPRTDGLAADLAQKRVWVAGCDRCQEVCPFNTKAARRADADGANTSEDRWSWAELFGESEAEYQTRVQGSALSRIRFADAQRNLRTAFAALPPEIRKEILAHFTPELRAKTQPSP